MIPPENGSGLDTNKGISHYDFMIARNCMNSTGPAQEITGLDFELGRKGF